MLAVVLAILAKLVVILKLGLRSISKTITSFIFLNIYHLHSTATCFDSFNSLYFKIIDKANSKFELKIKETLHINWRKPNLKAQQNHLALTLSHYSFCSPYSFLSLFVVLFLFFAFIFHLLFSLSLSYLLASSTVLITLYYYSIFL